MNFLTILLNYQLNMIIQKKKQYEINQYFQLQSDGIMIVCIQKQIMDSKQSIPKQRLVAFRHQLHAHPQIGFQEHETRKRIKSILKQFGVQESQMKELPPTALYVDLKGKANPSGKPRCIAFRADMDALSIVEANHNLEYRSKNQGKAHMCGHDGHMTCLIAFVPIFMNHIDQIPSDKVIRLLFQPSEQGPNSGALKMIQDGCLQGVDQVYGFHQWPTAPLGELWCKQGPVMSEITILQIKIIGTSGHGSQPQKTKQSIRPAIKFYQQALDFLDNLKKQKEGKLVCTLPIFQAGERFNVISQSVFISGSIRSFQQGLKDVIIQKLTSLLQQIKNQGFKYEFTANTNSPMNVNTKLEAEHVMRVGRKVFGQNKVSEGRLPFRASQDFAFFTRQRPGAFFFLSTAKGQNQPMLHNCHFNFNDDLIEPASKYWWELAKDRLLLEN